MIFILTKVNSIYGDVSREGLLATGALLLGAGGENCQKHFKMSNDYLGFAGLLGAGGDNCHHSIKFEFRLPVLRQGRCVAFTGKGGEGF